MPLLPQKLRKTGRWAGRALSKALTAGAVNLSPPDLCGKSQARDDVPSMKAGCLCTFAVFAAAVLGLGCQARPAAAGPDGRQTATYRGRTLTADLPRQVRVPSVAAAAEVALRHRGYAVTKAPTTEDFARVEGEPPKAGWGERVVVRARQTSAYTRVEVIAQPLGDQVLSRSLLDEMLANLGI